MPPVYSKQFISQRGLSGDGGTVLVPGGHVYVVKQLTFYSDPLLGTARGFFEHVDTGGAVFACAAPILVPTWQGFFGTLVFEPGQSFRWRVAAALGDAADVFAAGFDLTLP